MPEFETYVDVDIDDFLNACSNRERDDLIDALEEDGWVKRVARRGAKTNEQGPSILEMEW